MREKLHLCFTRGASGPPREFRRARPQTGPERTRNDLEWPPERLRTDYVSSPRRSHRNDLSVATKIVGFRHRRPKLCPVEPVQLRLSHAAARVGCRRSGARREGGGEGENVYGITTATLRRGKEGGTLVPNAKKETAVDKKECNTRTSQEVTHPSTTLAQARLTSEF
jgi:hypothetical protein